MQVVRRMEACGQRSGRPTKSVVIADCGELPSRRQILARLVERKEEEANLKKDPLQARLCAPSYARQPPQNSSKAPQRMVQARVGTGQVLRARR